MRKEIIIAGLSLVATGFVSAKSDKQPNIVLFLVDDMGWQDTSVPFWEEETPFNRLFHTPNMERLAKQGVKFTSAYACSVSSPSRASLFTGMNAARHRVTNWTLHKNQEVDSKHKVLDFPQWNVNGISQTTDVERTCHALPLAQALKDGGYYTIHCGKAHFGAIGTPGANPKNLGFDVNIAGHACGGPGSYLGEDNYGDFPGSKEKNIWAVPGLEKYHGTDVFLTEAITREALAELDKRDKNKPFFLYMSHYAVHVPVKPDKRFYQKYLDQGIDQRDAAYATLVEGMDKSLGDLMDYLERNQLSDNTIIIFMSDNGGLSVEPSMRSGELNTHNWPLNSGKGSAYEGGIREPMIVSWPGVTKAGTSCDDYLIIEDFYPTLLEMAHIPIPKTPQVIDGKSFIPLLTGKGENPSKGRALYWNFPNNWGPVGPGIGATCSIRKEDWKLIYYYATGRKELFNIRQDIGEKQDLSAQEPELVESLSKELGNYLREVKGQRPIFKETGKPVPWPDEVFETENLADKPWETTGEVKNGSWRGFKVHESKLNEFCIWIAEPKIPAEGNPWILRIQDFGDGYHCEINEMLLQAGVHVVAINSYNVCGADYGLNLMDSLYTIAREHFGLPSKCALGCVSRAGLSAYRWAVRHPERVACIYGEGPVLDFKTWPMSWEPSAGNWTKLKEYYGFKTDEEAIAYQGNPIDNLAPIAKAKIPLRHVISLTDEHDTKIVPNDKNTLKAQRLLKQMGHDIDVVVTPEGVKAPYMFDSESVRFILSKTILANKSNN